MFVRPAMVPNAALSITSQTTPRPASIAVATTEGLLPNAPSPTSATTARSGCASLTPRAGAGLTRGRPDRGIAADRAAADQRDDRAIRLRQLDAQRRRRPEPHRRES